MPLLVPLFYDAEFVLAIAMAQFAMFGMFMRTMTYPISFLPLVNNDTLVFVVLESAYNILLVTLVVLGFLYDGYMGVGVGIAVAHTVDFVVVYSVARFKYGMRLSVEAVRYFMVQLPLFVAVIAVSMSYSCSWYYWLMGGVLVLVSSAVSLWMFSRMAVLPSIVGKISKVFKR